VDKVKEYTKDFKCKVSIIIEEKNLGYMGHAIRNKHKNLEGDFVFHVDDDDYIVEDCLESLRKICIDTNKIYMFKMKVNSNTVFWKTNDRVWPNETATPMGIVPIELNKKSDFGYFYGGDYNYYENLSNQGFPIVFVDKIIYIVRPDLYGTSLDIE
jgi:GT2 family glycosyltransferase